MTNTGNAKTPAEIAAIAAARRTFSPTEGREFDEHEEIGRRIAEITKNVERLTSRTHREAAEYVFSAAYRCPSVATGRFLQVWAEMGNTSPARALAAAYSWAAEMQAYEWHMTDPDVAAFYER